MPCLLQDSALFRLHGAIWKAWRCARWSDCSDCASRSGPLTRTPRCECQCTASRGVGLLADHISMSGYALLLVLRVIFVPVKDPFNREYLRKPYICGEFIKRKDNLG